MGNLYREFCTVTLASGEQFRALNTVDHEKGASSIVDIETGEPVLCVRPDAKHPGMQETLISERLGNKFNIVSDAPSESGRTIVPEKPLTVEQMKAQCPFGSKP